MNEAVIINDLLVKIDQVARQMQVKKVTSVKVRMGALTDISSDSFRDQFRREAQGTMVEGARLDIEMLHDDEDPKAREIMLEYLEVAC